MAIHFKHAFLDIDYTLINFKKGHDAALNVLRKECGKKFTAQFDLVFRTILLALRVKDDDWSNVPGGQESYNSLIKTMQNLQHADNYPTVWSRELHATIAAARCGTDIDAPKAIKIVDLYWQNISEHSEVYPDAKKFISLLHDNNITYHLFTGSDGRLIYKNGLWRYNPNYSAEKKMERVLALQASGIKPASVTIGDPEDKPHPSFYNRMMSNAANNTKKLIKSSQSIVVGDSFKIDVGVPMEQYGYKAGYWVNRQCKPGRISDNIFCINSLMDIPVVV